MYKVKDMPKEWNSLSDWRINEMGKGVVLSMAIFSLGWLLLFLKVISSPEIPVIIPHLWLWIIGVFILCWEIIFISLFLEHNVTADYRNINVEVYKFRNYNIFYDNQFTITSTEQFVDGVRHYFGTMTSNYNESIILKKYYEGKRELIDIISLDPKETVPVDYSRAYLTTKYVVILHGEEVRMVKPIIVCNGN